jgi:penicillin amidase
MTSFPSDPTVPDSNEPPDPHSPDEQRLLTRRDEANPEPSAKEPKARRSGLSRTSRIMLYTFITLLILCAVAVFSAGIYLRHAMRAALPQIDGAIHISGLSAPVTVTRDANGVPSIQAATLDDLLFAQGFITAQDRLWQMDALRRHSAGELAEILGPSMVEHDRTQRTLQLRAAADRAIAVLPPDQFHQLDAYAHGVNAFIAQNADHLPIEFHLLHYTPAPWTPRDSLLVALAMTQDLSTEFPTKLLRESFSAHMPPELLGDLYPVGSWRDHPPAQSVPDLTSPRPEIDQIPLDDSQSRLTTTPGDLLAAKSKLSLQTCEDCRSGSNNWAVAGTRSASGMPLVSNDMHLALSVPDIWYETSLHSADGTLDVAGLTLPGTPFVIVGRNAHVAWSFTNLGGDVQDIYIEHLRGTGAATEFQRPDGTWAAVEHHSEHIRVRGGSDVTLDVQTTTHAIGATGIATPIITPLYPSEHRALSLAWTAYDPTTVTSPFLAADAATDGASLVAAFSTFGGPTLNLIYADDHNHIGYQAIGRIPIRGPAIHHPIAPPPTQIPDGPTPPPTDDESGSLVMPHPLVISIEAHSAQWRDRSIGFPLALSKGVSSRPERSAVERPAFLTAGAYIPQRRRPQPEEPSPAPAEAIIPAPPPPLDYTIGSAIPAIPVDSLDPNAQWSGYIPYAALPAVINPSAGFLATANARISNDDYPYAIALNWAAPYRVERITHLLANSTGLTPADMLRIQMDIHSELDLAFAQRLAYALDHTTDKSLNSRRLHQAADILRAWDGDVDIDAAAPEIVAAARAELWPMLLVPQITKHDGGSAKKDTTPAGIAHLYSWAEQGYALEELVLHQPARWLPPGVANWNDLLATAVERGLTTAKSPADLSTWSYSKTHPIEIDHPLLSNPYMERLLGITGGSGPRVVPGDGSTVKATGRGFGPSERFTADLINSAATTSNITTGESGNPVSRWYLDQLPHWLAGTTLPLPLHDAPATHTLILQP